MYTSETCHRKLRVLGGEGVARVRAGPCACLACLCTVLVCARVLCVMEIGIPRKEWVAVIGA